MFKKVNLAFVVCCAKDLTLTVVFKMMPATCYGNL